MSGVTIFQAFGWFLGQQVEWGDSLSSVMLQEFGNQCICDL